MLGPLLTIILSDDYLYKRVEPSSSVFIELNNQNISIKYYDINKGIVKEHKTPYKNFKQRMVFKYTRLENDICNKRVDVEKESKKVRDADTYIKNFLRMHDVGGEELQFI